MYKVGLDLFDVYTINGYVNLGLLKVLKEKAIENGNSSLSVLIDEFIEKEKAIFDSSINLIALRNEYRKGSPLTIEDIIHSIITSSDMRKHECNREINIIEALPSDYDGYTEEQKLKTRYNYNLINSISEDYNSKLKS